MVPNEVGPWNVSRRSQSVSSSSDAKSCIVSLLKERQAINQSAQDKSRYWRALQSQKTSPSAKPVKQTFLCQHSSSRADASHQYTFCVVRNSPSTTRRLGYQTKSGVRTKKKKRTSCLTRLGRMGVAIRTQESRYLVGESGPVWATSRERWLVCC